MVGTDEGDASARSDLKRARSEHDDEDRSRGEEKVRKFEVEEEEEEDEDKIYLPKSTSRTSQKKGQECPYLDTVSRQVRR